MTVKRNITKYEENRISKLKTSGMSAVPPGQPASVYWPWSPCWSSPEASGSWRMSWQRVSSYQHTAAVQMTCELWSAEGSDCAGLTRNRSTVNNRKLKQPWLWRQRLTRTTLNNRFKQQGNALHVCFTISYIPLPFFAKQRHKMTKRFTERFTAIYCFKRKRKKSPKTDLNATIK